MELLIDFVKILIPAGSVLFAMYLTVKAFLNKEFEKKLLETKENASKLVLPIRLQAYERICLYLERISPHNLILRTNEPGYTASQFQQKLISDIREELNHNLAQQIYLSDAAWNLVKSTTEDVIGIISGASQFVAPDAKGIDLAKAIFNELVNRNEDPTLATLKFVKNEIRKVF